MIRQYIADIIRQRLKQLKLTQRDFARMMNVESPMVSKWLSGNNNFTIDMLEKIEAILRIDFFGRHNCKNNLPCAPCLNTDFIKAKA